MTKITFEDHGQDFLTFTTDNKGNIVDVQPFQFGIWSQHRIDNMDDLYVNGYVKLTKVKGEDRFSQMTIKYPIEKIEVIKGRSSLKKAAMLLLLPFLFSCSAFRHTLPDSGQFFVTKSDTCTRQQVRMELRQDIFASKIRLKYQDERDTLDIRKLFRQEDANTYSNGVYTVVIKKQYLLEISNGRKIVVDYRCAER